MNHRQQLNFNSTRFLTLWEESTLYSYRAVLFDTEAIGDDPIFFERWESRSPDTLVLWSSSDRIVPSRRRHLQQVINDLRGGRAAEAVTLHVGA